MLIIFHLSYPCLETFTKPNIGNSSIACGWQKMEIYSVGGTAKGAASGETYAVW